MAFLPPRSIDGEPSRGTSSRLLARREPTGASLQSHKNGIPSREERNAFPRTESKARTGPTAFIAEPVTHVRYMRDTSAFGRSWGADGAVTLGSGGSLSTPRAERGPQFSTLDPGEPPPDCVRNHGQSAAEAAPCRRFLHRAWPGPSRRRLQRRPGHASHGTTLLDCPAMASDPYTLRGIWSAALTGALIIAFGCGVRRHSRQPYACRVRHARPRLPTATSAGSWPSTWCRYATRRCRRCSRSARSWTHHPAAESRAAAARGDDLVPEHQCRAGADDHVGRPPVTATRAPGSPSELFRTTLTLLRSN